MDVDLIDKREIAKILEINIKTVCYYQRDELFPVSAGISNRNALLYRRGDIEAFKIVRDKKAKETLAKRADLARKLKLMTEDDYEEYEDELSVNDWKIDIGFTPLSDFSNSVDNLLGKLFLLTLPVIKHE